tara:strand:+ start:932 stop:1948 length:1017 start_codon:yes stop_codon:yes gene_type:complete
MKNSIVFISNAFGGILTFEKTLIKFITKMKIEYIFIDYKKKVSHNKINIFNKIWKTFVILKKIKIKNRNKNTIFIFSNPAIFVIYFLYIKLFYKNKKIFFFAHSHLTKKSILLYLSALLSSIFCIFSNKIFYVSKFTKKYWEKTYFFSRFANNLIQYNSVEPQKKINRFIKINNKKFRIGFVGRVDKEKGLEKFLKIAYENKVHFIFNIFANNKLNLNKDQKKYIKFFYNKDVSTIYKNIDLLLITSPIENCPFTILEAKSYGIPALIYFTKGGINELIKNNHDGIIINSKNKNINIIKYINKVKFNYKFFSHNAYMDAKKYNASIKIPKLITNELLR